MDLEIKYLQHGKGTDPFANVLYLLELFNKLLKYCERNSWVNRGDGLRNTYRILWMRRLGCKLALQVEFVYF